MEVKEGKGTEIKIAKTMWEAVLWTVIFVGLVILLVYVI